MDHIPFFPFRHEDVFHPIVAVVHGEALHAQDALNKEQAVGLISMAMPANRNVRGEVNDIDIAVRIPVDVAVEGPSRIRMEVHLGQETGGETLPLLGLPDGFFVISPRQDARIHMAAGNVCIDKDSEPSQLGAIAE